MRAIIIGCGVIGSKRAEVLFKLGIKIVSCIDSNIKTAENLAKKYNAKFSNNLNGFFDFEDVDVAFIATPHKYLCKIALNLVNENISVFIEKPGSICSKELEKLKTISDERKIFVGFGFNHRFHNSVLKAFEIQNNEDLGSPMMLRGRYGHGGRVGYDREWRSNKELSGGGELLDQGSHLIDLAHLFMGDSIKVEGFCSTLFWDMEVDDNAFVLLTSVNNCISQIHVSCSEWKNLFSLELYYSKGKIHLEGLGGSYGSEKLTFYKMSPKMGPPESQNWEWPLEDNSWEIETRQFIKGIRNNHMDNYIVDADKAIKNLKVIEEIYKKDIFKPPGEPKSFELLGEK